MPRNRKLWVIECLEKPGSDWLIYGWCSTRKEAREAKTVWERNFFDGTYTTERYRIVKYVPEERGIGQ